MTDLLLYFSLAVNAVFVYRSYQWRQFHKQAAVAKAKADSEYDHWPQQAEPVTRASY